MLHLWRLYEKQTARLTHSVEQRCADWFDNEVVFQAQFLQVFIKVICVHRQMNHFSKPCHTAVFFFKENCSGYNKHGGSVLLTLTVHFNDFIQAGENGGQLDGGQELLPLQRLGENHLKDAQHPHMSVLSSKQLWEWNSREGKSVTRLVAGAAS